MEGDWEPREVFKAGDGVTRWAPGWRGEGVRADLKMVKRPGQWPGAGQGGW